MAWQQVAFNIAAARTGLAEAVLEAAGASAVTWAEVAGSDAVLEPPPGQTQLWDQVRVEALFTAETRLDSVRSALLESLGELPDNYSVQPLADRQWEREWLTHFQPQSFGHGLWIIPNALEPPEPGAVNLRLDPGLAFGTGTHPTTALCLEALAERPPVGQRVIDYGCGSGLLAIAALRLGATEAVAIDNDPQARLASRDNAERNGVADRLVIADVDAPLPTVDWVLANILAGVLCDLAPRLLAALRDGGQITLAGLLSEQATAVREAYAPNVLFSPAIERDGWVRLDGKASAL
ncbi:MAG: 50S ribosomal protein L11 methyltransferase [Spiribacter sp.]|jgi:ribosomal protein L11 methyltransferase|nr:50S ribosomal protein L11 methyltransferase [Spiribacter sp.]MDR9489825.1 50S ribosomal protein L11 methyltransferase [Spiribacter sp.]